MEILRTIRNKWFILLLSLSMGVSSLFILQTSTIQAADPYSVVEEFIYYQNQQQWEKAIALWDEPHREKLQTFIHNRMNRQNGLGLYNIKKAKIVRWKELKPDVAYPYSYIVDDRAKYYYLAVEQQVHKEDKYNLNGLNYFLVVVTQKNGEWKISQFSTAPVDLFVAQRLGFGTSDELGMANILKQRYLGNVVNRSGRILERLSIPESSMIKKGTSLINWRPQTTQNEFSAQARHHQEPTSIRVYLSQKKNKRHYGCPNGCVRRINFKYYIRNVLPNEWVPSWHSNSLKTGALCVKMYAWYAFYYPLANSVGADVYDDTRSHVYLVNSSHPATDKAISSMDGIGMHRQDNKMLFLTEYSAGYYMLGGKSSGKVWQWGSKYFADRNQKPAQILSYYYSGSKKVGGRGKKIEFFSY
jgi:hypothetical protein